MRKDETVSYLLQNRRRVFLFTVCGALALVCTLFSLASCGGSGDVSFLESSGTDASASSGTFSTGSDITGQDAIDIAVSEAGLKDSEIIFSNANLTRYKNTESYKVVLKTSNTVSIYFIARSDGSVLMFETTNKENPSGAPKGDYIGLDKAKELAVSAAGVLMDEVIFTKGELDEEEGRMVYELEFDEKGFEYDFHIDATTGEIIKFDKEAR